MTCAGVEEKRRALEQNADFRIHFLSLKIASENEPSVLNFEQTKENAYAKRRLTSKMRHQERRLVLSPDR
jgi:hypothetical protein